MTRVTTFKEIYHDLLTKGKESSPRGQKTIELENYQFTLPAYERFTNFPSRKMSLDYIKWELQWYLKGDRYDLSIKDKAKIWETAITDGQINSNYGHYIFKQKGIDYVVECLVKDPDSRRALITILGQEHLYMKNNDVPCTVSLGFRIRNNRLNCSVHMRSNDAIFGMTNDVPFFSFIHECVHVMLLESSRYAGRLEMGTLTQFAESFHVYERHYDMIKTLIDEDVVPIECPRLQSAEELGMLRNGDHHDASLMYPFSQWLMSTEDR